MEYPYSDDNMKFDVLEQKYVLTEHALINNGIDIRTRLSHNKMANATLVINRILKRVSEIIYNYIHTFNNDNKTQDELIAHIPSLRNIIYNAMLNQAEYFLYKGDLSRSADRNLRMLAIDETAKEYLNTTVQEIGVPITYAGGFMYGFS